MAAAGPRLLLECPICSYEYDYDTHAPHLLFPCGHGLCGACLETLQRQGRVICPLDRERVVHAARNREMVMAIQACRAQQAGGAPVAAADVKEEPKEASVNINFKGPMCERHPGQEVRYICRRDGALCCGDCALTGVHTGHIHDVVSLSTAYTEGKESLEAAVAAADRELPRLMDLLEASSRRQEEVHSNSDKIVTRLAEVLTSRRTELASRVAAAIEGSGSLTNEAQALRARMGLLRQRIEAARSCLDDGQELVIALRAQALAERVHGALQQAPVSLAHLPHDLPPAAVDSVVDGIIANVLASIQQSLAGRAYSSVYSPPTYPMGMEQQPQPSAEQGSSGNDDDMLGRTVTIMDTGQLYTTINQSDALTWPSRDIKEVAGVRGWGTWHPEEGSRGEVVWVGTHANTLARVLVLRMWGFGAQVYYVPIGEQGVEIVS